MEAAEREGGEMMVRITRSEYIMHLRAGIRRIRRSKRGYWMTDV